MNPAVVIVAQMTKELVAALHTEFFVATTLSLLSCSCHRCCFTLTGLTMSVTCFRFGTACLSCDGACAVLPVVFFYRQNRVRQVKLLLLLLKSCF